MGSGTSRRCNPQTTHVRPRRSRAPRISDLIELVVERTQLTQRTLGEMIGIVVDLIAAPRSRVTAPTSSTAEIIALWGTKTPDVPLDATTSACCNASAPLSYTDFHFAFVS